MFENMKKKTSKNEIIINNYLQKKDRKKKPLYIININKQMIK